MNLFDDHLGGPLDLIAGLPLHPLASHFPVVLVPLVALCALAMSYWPSFSRRYGRAILILAVIAQLSLFLSKASGQVFKERLGKEIERHQSYGEIAPFTFIPLLIFLFIRFRMDRSGATVGSAGLRRAVSILLAISAIFALVYIFLTGHSGATSVWGWLGKN